MKNSQPEEEGVQTASTPTPTETTVEKKLDRPSTEASNSHEHETDSVVEGQEPKSAHSDISRIEGGVDRPDIDVDEGVDLQGKLIFYVFSQMTLYTLSMAVIY